MALTKCSACDGSVSSAAVSCPHCGHPLAGSSRTMKPTGPSSLRRNIGALILLFLVGVFIYKGFLNQEQRDQVNTLASATGLPVVPWIDRAETAARRTFDSRSGENIASSIQGITHPTGNSPTLQNMSISKIGDTLVVRFSVNWRGGLLGGHYTTIVEWKCTQTQNLGIEIISDNAAIGIAGNNMRKLERYFQTEVYPVLKSNAG